MKKKPAKRDEGSEQMDRVVAARAYLQGKSPNRARNEEMFAFLSIFHPELTHEKLLRLTEKEGGK